MAIPVYTFRKAHYANPEHTAAIVNTLESADIAVSRLDTPELWAQLHRELGSAIAVYKPPGWPEARPLPGPPGGPDVLA